VKLSVARGATVLAEGWTFTETSVGGAAFALAIADALKLPCQVD